MILWSHAAQSTRHLHYQTQTGVDTVRHSDIAKQIQFKKHTNEQTFETFQRFIKWNNKKKWKKQLNLHSRLSFDSIFPPAAFVSSFGGVSMIRKLE